MTQTEQKNKWMMLAIAICLGCGSAVAINSHLSNKSTELERKNRVEYVHLLVAARALKRDSILRAEDLRGRAFQKQGVALDALSAEELESVVGKRLIADVQEGTWILASSLSEPNIPTLAEKLDSSIKAITLQVDTVNAMSGLLKPGDYVDLYVSFDHDGKRITALLLGAVEVLATDHLTADGGGSEEIVGRTYSTITVGVSQSDSHRLVTARQSGSISAVMSGRGSVAANATDPKIAHNLAEMLGLVAMPSEPPAPVIYGDRLDSVEDSFEPEVSGRDLRSTAEHERRR